MASVSTEIPIGELSSSLAFGAAYFSVSSIGTRLTSVTETYTVDGFIGGATFSCKIPDTEGRMQVTITADSKNPYITVEIVGEDKSKLKGYLEEIAQRIADSLNRFSGAPGEQLAQASKAVIIERKLDEALNQLLSDSDYQKVYVVVADARERLIRLGGEFDPVILQMGAILQPLAGGSGVIPKDVSEKLALNLLRWKKRIKQLVESLTNQG